MYLVVTDNTQGLVDYTIDESVWTLIEDLSSTDEDTDPKTYVYYTTVDPDDNDDDGEQSFSALVGNTVYYSSSLTNDDLEDAEDMTLSFQSYAIQTEGFSSALSAYYAAVNGVPTATVTEASIPSPEFTFTDEDGTTYSGDDVTTISSGGLTYVMPNVSSTSDNIGSITTDDGDTVYYVIVEGSTSKETLQTNLYRYYPIFTGVTIVDYTDADGSSTTYNTSTSSKPDAMVTALDAQEEDLDGDWEKSGAATNDWDDYEEDDDGYLSLLTKALDLSNSSHHAEATCWLKYSFTAGNGETYYYYIGYHFDEVSYCVAESTLITLADGSQTAVENLTGEEELLVFNHETGTFATSSIIYLQDAGYDTYEIVNLEFSDGTTVRTVNEHGFFDVTQNKYVYVTADIETYGLSTYEEWNDYASEELFYAYKGPYLKVAMGKGTLTYEEILSLIEAFQAYFLDDDTDDTSDLAAQYNTSSSTTAGTNENTDEATDTGEDTGEDTNEEPETAAAADNISSSSADDAKESAQTSGEDGTSSAADTDEDTDEDTNQSAEDDAASSDIDTADTSGT